MSTDSAPEAPLYPRSVVLIDDHHDSHQTGVAASVTVPMAVALDDSLALPGVAFCGARLLGTGYGLSPLIATLCCREGVVEFKPGVNGPHSVRVAGISVLGPAWSENPVREIEGGFEVDLYVQSIIARSPRPEDKPTGGLWGHAYQRWNAPHVSDGDSPRH